MSMQNVIPFTRDRAQSSCALTLLRPLIGHLPDDVQKIAERHVRKSITHSRSVHYAVTTAVDLAEREAREQKVSRLRIASRDDNDPPPRPAA